MVWQAWARGISAGFLTFILIAGAWLGGVWAFRHRRELPGIARSFVETMIWVVTGKR